VGRTGWIISGILVAAGLYGATRFVGSQSIDWRIVVSELPSPAQPGTSGEPQLTAFGGHAILSWIERDGDQAALKFAEREGAGWTAPRVVASGDDWFVNWADVPSVVRLADGSLAAHWLQKSAADPYAYDIQLSFSRNSGETWTPPTSPHHDGTPTEHGFASLFPAPGGGLGLVWLDGRAMKSDQHGGDPVGDMAFRAATFGSDGAQQSESQIDDRVCECCPTAVAATADGAVAAFRNRGDEELRDIHVTRLENGKWSTPRPVHDDGWRIDACPVNGPALSANARNVAIAWFNAKTDQGHTFVAFSTDGGKTFGAPIAVDDVASLGRVDVELLDDGAAAVAWIEYAESRAQFRVRRVTPSGRRSASTTVSALAASRASGYPRLARVGNELIFAWTETNAGAARVRTAVALQK
jgi:hypothetical protein